MRLAILSIFLIGLASVRAQQNNMIQLRDGESPDHRYNCLLMNRDGKLQFRVIERSGGGTVIDVPSTYESLLAKDPRAVDMARRVKVGWSPDSRFVIFKEPDNSEGQRGVVLVDVQPTGTKETGAKQVVLSMERMKALSSKEHTDWSLEFDRWLGNRMFLVILYGVTFRPDQDNEHERISLVCIIKKDGSVNILNADET